MDLVTWTFAQSKKVDQNRPLFIDATNPLNSLSTNQCRTLVKQLISGFRNQGLENGDAVCMLSFNNIYYTTLYLGIIASGGIFTGANPGYTSHELAHHLRITESKYIVSQPKTLQVALEAAKKVGIAPSKVFVLDVHDENVPEGRQSWRLLLDHGERDWKTDFVASERVAAYLSTSGTSGLPKAAVLTHSYMVSQAEVIGRVGQFSSMTSQLVSTPPFHAFTIPLQHGIPLKYGSTCYVMPRFEQTSFLRVIEKFHIERTIIVPPILSSLAKDPHSNSLKSLRSIFVGGSCASEGMQRRLYEKLHPNTQIVQVYGLTETGWASMWQGKRKDSTGSIGTPLPGTRFRLVDRTGQIIKRDDIQGEIHIRVPQPMKGYLNNQSATSEAFSTDGWVRSGDVGCIRGGLWYAVDRTKDMIKVRGWQVSPAEIEAVLMAHLEIDDAAVIGIPADDGTGEVPLGFVVRSDDSEVSEEELKSFLRVRLARYKAVDEIVFVDRIPRNPTGKILRRVLKDTRRSETQTPDQEAASAYLRALRKLEQEQAERVKSPSIEGRRERTWSPSVSLTDTSTVEGSVVASPDVEREEPVVEIEGSGKKRKNTEVYVGKYKVRNTRVAGDELV